MGLACSCPSFSCQKECGQEYGWQEYEAVLAPTWEPCPDFIDRPRIRQS